MPKSILALLFFFLCCQCFAQLQEDFSDGNFTDNPAWVGNAADFIVNAEGELQSNNTVLNSSYYLSTANSLATTAEWNVKVRLTFNTSSANYADVFLIASSADLSAPATTGYFVRLGNTDDEISLYRKDASGAVKIIDGLNGVLNTSNNNIALRVVRTTDNRWLLSRDLSGLGSFTSEGSVTDATYTTSASFGFLVKQSTASFFQRHYFDNITVANYVPDVTPPAVQSLITISQTALDVVFTEAVDPVTAGNPANYAANNSLNNPASVIIDAANAALVHLGFSTPFGAGVSNTLTVSNVKDLAGNILTNGTATFTYLPPYTAKAFDLVIDEIFPDPTPVVGLPEAEFIEIKNTSGRSINLQGFKLNSLSTTSAAFPALILEADSFLVVSGNTAAPRFAAFGRSIGITSFPTLDNNGTTIWLTAPSGLVVHSVNYSSTWYQNTVKSAGGWTLEMIDTHNPCAGMANWKASTNPLGGTPGRKNAVDGINADAAAPVLLRAAATTANTLVLTFNEAVNVTTAEVAANYTISEGINTPVAAIALPPTFNKVQLTIGTAIVAGKVYSVTANNIKDCSGNIQSSKTVLVGLPIEADSNDIVINEILFDPKPGATDYIELYNNSSKIVNLNSLYIANRNSSNAIGSIAKISEEDILFFPGEFVVLSEDGEIVQQNYAAQHPENFINVSMPSMPDTDGFAVLLNGQGAIVDEVHYSAKWHFKLLDDEEGISLERIDYKAPSQKPESWHSAASTAGYGTPGYQNSQFKMVVTVPGDVSVTPKTFSPDNDGVDDFAIVRYQLTEPGFVANITIFDAAGRPVKSLAKNATLALSGTFRWDGLNDKFYKVPVGPYIILTEIFNLSGKKQTFKNTVVVAARL